MGLAKTAKLIPLSDWSHCININEDIFIENPWFW
jgi:hypothetical protein